jgi:glycosyltransferase involved in cell wall biosynthesis
LLLKLKLGRRVRIIVINHAEKPFTGIRKQLQKLADRVIWKYFFVAGEMGAWWVNAGIIKDGDKIAAVMEASSHFTEMDRQKAVRMTGAVGNPVFLWVGRLNPNKDPMTAIRAFHDLIHYRPGAILYMIYHTDELNQQLISFCNKNAGLQKAVKFIGKVPHPEMQYWYSSADFILAASHYEGSGVAVCEAMSCGCIPILTNIISFRKMTGPGKCGLLYEAGNATDLFHRLKETMELDIIKEREKVLKQFKEELSFEAIAGKMDSIINTIPA